MKLYNTLTRSIDQLQLLAPPKVTVYTCGPTVYDYAHIGHWFNYVRMDILIRALKANGMNPEWVMNITDVGHLVSDADEGEDKLEKGARREGKTAWEVAEFYTADFLECMQLLNILTPDHITKATEHIPEQIALIKTLEAKGYTYVISDGVYYDTSKFEGYAAFARLDLEGQQAGARVEYNREKRGPTDFALWKFSPAADGAGAKRRDMEWDSPWGAGFPGWHIECSAMSMKYLGDTLDIHTGGIDHVPVHHTNEIAQSEAATGKRFANYWLHSNHVMVDGEKISKSLGNGIRLQDIMQQEISPEAVRLHVLESHYRSQSQFSMESLQSASNRLKGLRAMAALRYQAVPEPGDAPNFSMAHVPQILAELLAEDLNTPGALAFLSDVENQLSTVLLRAGAEDEFVRMLEGIDAVLGTKLSDEPNISEDQQLLIEERETARRSKDWARADQLRDKLAQAGLGVRDTAHGPIWFRQ
jgi:cysteinyl-tRNA synthetase